MMFMWYHGGRKVLSATIHRSGKMTKSMFAVPAVSEGEVRTVKIEGSGWSNEIGPTGEKARQVVLVGCVIAVPANHINRGVRQFRFVE